ncbi:MAG: class I SAM-dependent methyltransferase family protein [Methanobacteriaceae archaeon]|jgi:tRNA wybutosine-synthesizing protein 2|nr:class I SAM-dependent methyltransferase family protein [Methanobacteriaceae archaeon]
MKWKKIGDILILDKFDENSDLDKLLKEHRVKTIIQIENIQGTRRKPNIKILKGSETDTIHKENTCLFKLDLSKVMWSKGNTHERLRIAKEVLDNEIVLDMFAGIGYFSIPIGVHSKAQKIYSVEINPDSFYFLNENIKINKINKDYERIEAILGDSKNINLDEKVDRLIMGYVKTTHYYLESGINSLKKGGIIHYHETVPDKLIESRPLSRIKKIANSREVELINIRKIKKYSPGVSHIVVDARIY